MLCTWRNEFATRRRQLLMWVRSMHSLLLEFDHALGIVARLCGQDADGSLDTSVIHHHHHPLLDRDGCWGHEMTPQSPQLRPVTILVEDVVNCMATRPCPVFDVIQRMHFSIGPIPSIYTVFSSNHLGRCIDGITMTM